MDEDLCEHGDDPLLCPPCQKPKVTSSQVYMTAIQAQFDGQCLKCDKPIVGQLDLIAKEEEYGPWIHATCRD